MKKVNIIFGDCHSQTADLICAYLSLVYKDKCEINLLHGKSISEVVSLVNENEFDLFMLVLNNLRFDGSEIRDSLELVNYVKAKYHKPIFAFYGYIQESWKDVLAVELLHEMPTPIKLVGQKFKEHVLKED